jgi:hypothetical protein
MVDDNSYPEDFFDGEDHKDENQNPNESNDDLFDGLEDLFGDDDQSFDEFLDETYEQQGIDKLEEFQGLLEEFFPDGENAVGGQLIKSISLEKSGTKYREETWQFKDIQVTRVFIDTEKTEEQTEEEHKNKYVDFLSKTSEDVKEEIKKAVSEEDYNRAAELKSRLERINTYLSKNKK